MQKELIRLSFTHAASQYDCFDRVQRRVATQLATRMVARWPSLSKILEIGCGTGNLTEQLAQAYPRAQLVASDLSADMLEACEHRVGARARYQHLDGETAAVEGFELIASSLAFQWFADQPRAIKGLAQTGTRLAIATLVEGTFAEWKEAHARLGLEDGLLSFMPRPLLCELSAQLGAHCVIETIADPHRDGLSFVRTLKGLGAATPRVGHQPVSLRRVLHQFREGLVANYCVAYLLIGPPL